MEKNSNLISLSGTACSLNIQAAKKTLGLLYKPVRHRKY